MYIHKYLYMYTLVLLTEWPAGHKCLCTELHVHVTIDTLENVHCTFMYTYEKYTCIKYNVHSI